MHGGSFTGNSAKSLLRNVDLLEAMCPNNPSVLKFVRAFRCFSDVVTFCFGASLQPQFRRYISEFEAPCEQLPLNVTPKIHAIIFHVPEFCEHTRRGLGQYSEQCIESLHHSFADTWKNFKFFESHPQFSDRLLRSVCVYNSRHIWWINFYDACPVRVFWMNTCLFQSNLWLFAFSYRDKFTFKRK